MGVYKRLSTEKFAISTPREMGQRRVPPRLTISGLHSAGLLALRDKAFAVQGMSSFKPCIRIYRDSLQGYLDILTARKSASHAEPDVVPPSNFEATRDAEVEPHERSVPRGTHENPFRVLPSFDWPKFRIAVSGSIPSARPLRMGYQQGRDIWPICQVYCG